MGKPRRIAPEIKEQILKRIKDDGVTVAQAAADHGIHETTIYDWLSKGVAAIPTLRELRSIGKENGVLKSLVGELTMKLSHAQKKSGGGKVSLPKSGRASPLSSVFQGVWPGRLRPRRVQSIRLRETDLCETWIFPSGFAAQPLPVVKYKLNSRFVNK